MIIIPFDANYAPLSWKGLKPASTHKRTRAATVTCPDGHTFTLLDHTIADDGTVSPSVVCPYMGCIFHEFAKLEGWKPDAP